nr:CRISP/Allergen/PR-1-like [Parasteatoda tepidariorum]
MSILTAHNEVRRRVAYGQETRAGGLPQAANMMELSWDPELAFLAQSWVDQCTDEIECLVCKWTGNFTVGQNTLKLTNRWDVTNYRPDWKQQVEYWYKTVEQFDARLISAMRYDPRYHPFVQLVWAGIHKVGCGYAAYRSLTNPAVNEFKYVCNYGPGDNLNPHDPPHLYAIGSPCSQCPLYSECVAGLCRLKSYAPVYLPKQSHRFFCSFESYDSNCNYAVTNPDKWRIIPAYGGNYFATVLSRQEYAASFIFLGWIISRKGSCLVVLHRVGYTKFSQAKFLGSLEAILDIFRVKNYIQFDQAVRNSLEFVRMYLPLEIDAHTRLGFRLSSQPPYPEPLYWEIREVRILDSCRISDD